MHPAKTIVINGVLIHDIVSFYKEVNGVFMQTENWQLAESLDAFNDLLYGSYGIIKDAEPLILVWKNHEQSRAALGKAATMAYYEKKLYAGSPFNQELIAQKLSELRDDKGLTYFDILIEIIKDHKNITLVLQ